MSYLSHLYRDARSLLQANNVTQHPLGYREHICNVIVAINNGQVSMSPPNRDKKAPWVHVQPYAPADRSGSKAAPAPLCDKAEYVFGLLALGDKKAKNVIREHDAWMAQLRSLCEAHPESNINQVLKAFENGDIAKLDFTDVLPGDISTFVVDGEYVMQDIAVQHYWGSVIGSDQVVDPDAYQVNCMLTGKLITPLKNHAPKIQIGGPKPVKLVCINEQAYSSYEWDRAQNIPVSAEAVATFSEAHTFLVNSDDHHISLGDGGVYVWWGAGAELTTAMFAKDEDVDNEAIDTPNQTLRALLRTPWKAEMPHVSAEFDSYHMYYLTPRAGRLISNGLDLDQHVLWNNLSAWFQRLHIQSNRYDANYECRGASLYALVQAIARPGTKFNDAKKHILPFLIACAYNREPISNMFAQMAIHRCFTELSVNHSRAALLKAAYAQTLSHNDEKEFNEKMTTLDTERDDPFYLFGRSIPMMDELQHIAHGRDFTIPFGSGLMNIAMINPSKAFESIAKMSSVYRSKITRYSQAKGYGIPLCNELDAIIARIPLDVLPSNCSQANKMIFLMGLYHQKTHFAENKAVNIKNAATRKAAEELGA